MSNGRPTTDASEVVAAMEAADRTGRAPDSVFEPGPPTVQTVRRWEEAAETNRLNEAHWRGVTSQSINVDLLGKLETLRARCAREISVNPFVEGVVNTHADDIVGPHGPTLQVQSDSTAYNDALEALWADWWLRPTTRRKITGTQLLKLWVRDLWCCGEYLGQKVTKRGAAGPVTMRINPLHPRRLATPPEFSGDPDVVLGVRLSDDGDPRQYYITQPNRSGAYELSTGQALPVPPDMILHGFLLHEDDQVRGAPWLAPSLPGIADLRDYDVQVLDAARQAADQAVFWYTNHTDATYLEVNESVEIERRTQSTGPPGWQPMQLTPQQPSTQYVDYRRERQAEIGRPVGMPLMMVRLDSQRHNYSSARFDGQGYARAIRGIQAWLADGDLQDLATEVAREGELARALPRRPERVNYEWTWPVRPHVDPAKEGAGERIGMENGSLPFADACAARGTDEDQVIAKYKRTNEKLEAAGLPPLPPLGSYPRKPIDLGAIYHDEDELEEEENTKTQEEEEPANAS